MDESYVCIEVASEGIMFLISAVSCSCIVWGVSLLNSSFDMEEIFRLPYWKYVPKACAIAADCA